MKDAYTILTVNPGSTGTKLGLVRGDEILLDLNVDPQGGLRGLPQFRGSGAQAGADDLGHAPERQGGARIH